MSRILLLFLCLASVLAVAAPALATTCGDDCYATCCTEDGACRSDDSITCLTDCLKDCGGDGVPPVPEPEPVPMPDDPQPDDPQPDEPAPEEPAPDNGSSTW